MTIHVLVIEDEIAIQQMLQYALEKEEYSVTTVTNVNRACSLLIDESGGQRFDLAIVDWMLPDGNGIELIRKLRRDELTRELPIIMLTAKGEENDISLGLDAGADDYMVKPFSPRELLSRLRALLRRSSSFSESSVLQRGPLSLSPESHQVKFDEQNVPMGHTEFKLLEFLMTNHGRVYSRSQLLDHVWGRNSFIEERTIDVHILRLRKCLKPFGADRMLQTVRGAGYRFSVENTAA